MSLQKFIAKNRVELDAYIERKLGKVSHLKNDEERRLWILNDETLYHWARANGVKI